MPLGITARREYPAFRGKRREHATAQEAAERRAGPRSEDAVSAPEITSGATRRHRSSVPRLLPGEAPTM